MALDLVRHVKGLGPQVGGWIVGASLSLRLPQDVWPKALLSRLLRVSSGRMSAARILFERGDPAGRRVFLNALAGTEEECQLAVSALGWVKGARSAPYLLSAYPPAPLGQRIRICLGMRLRRRSRVEADVVEDPA